MSLLLGEFDGLSDWLRTTAREYDANGLQDAAGQLLELGDVAEQLEAQAELSRKMESVYNVVPGPTWEADLIAAVFEGAELDAEIIEVWPKVVDLLGDPMDVLETLRGVLAHVDALAVMLDVSRSDLPVDAVDQVVLEQSKAATLLGCAPNDLVGHTARLVDALTALEDLLP